jgi:hypothetical protein
MKTRHTTLAGGSRPHAAANPPARAGLAWVLALLAAMGMAASAQDYMLGSFSAKTGSGIPASDDHIITGSINLGILVASEDEDHAMSGGITGGGLVVETADGIRLTIRLVSGGVEVSWPQETVDHVLEATPSLTAPEWQPVTITSTQASETSSVVVPITEATQFFRLRRVPAD